jgi:hypothetical protein
MNGNQFANRGDTSSIDGLIELQSPAAHSFTPAIDMNVAGASTGLQILRDTTLSNFWAVKTITGGLDLGLFVDNDSTHGIHIHSGTGLTSIPGGIGIGDDNLIYNPGSGVVNIEAGISGTDYFYSFRKTGEFDAGLVCIGGTCDGVTALGALNLHAGPIYISGTPGITKTCTVIPTGMTIQGGIITAVTGGTCI